MEQQDNDNINKELRVPTPDEKIMGLIADSIIQCSFYFNRCRGLLSPEETLSLSNNDKVIVRVGSLYDVISAQLGLVTNSKSLVYHKNPDDFDLLQEYSINLKECEQAIITADRTQNLADDFMGVRNRNNSADEINYLTRNFFYMMEDLEELFDRINRVLLRNGLLMQMSKHTDKRRKQSEVF